MPEHLYTWRHKGSTYAISARGRLLVPDREGDYLEPAAPGADLPENLELLYGRTGLDGSRIETFRVNGPGDYLRRFTPKSGSAWWDVWRPSGTDLARAYDAEGGAS